MDPFLFAAVILVYSLVLVWLVGRSAGQDNAASQSIPRAPARGVSARPTIERVFPDGPDDQHDNVQNFTRRMRQPSRSRSRSRAPAPVAQPRSRSRSRASIVPPPVARPRSTSRARTQSVVPAPVTRARSGSRTRTPSQPARRPRSPSNPREAPAPTVQAAPLLSTISGSSMSLSLSTVSSAPASSASRSGRRMSSRDVPGVTPRVDVPRISLSYAGMSQDPRFTEYREAPPLIRDDTISVIESGKGKGSASTVRGISTSIPASSVATSTLARKLTIHSLNKRHGLNTPPSESTPGPSKIEDADDDENPFAPRTPTSSASNDRGRSPALSVTLFRTPTPRKTPGHEKRQDFPIVAYDEDGVAIRKCDRTVKNVTTYWYQRDELSFDLLWSPPDLTHYSGLALGDLYYHCLPMRCQFWLWTLEDGEHVWKSILCGYMRHEDGRYLITTKVDRFPSWVQREAYRKALEYLDIA